MSYAKIVYSSDPKLNEKCQKCKELMSECTCARSEDITAFKGPVTLRLEKSGRGGKLVSVIDKFPKNEKYLKDLCSMLKKRCGVGGTYILGDQFGLIEIQGDKRYQLRQLLVKEQIVVKG